MQAQINTVNLEEFFKKYPKGADKAAQTFLKKSALAAKKSSVSFLRSGVQSQPTKALARSIISRSKVRRGDITILVGIRGGFSVPFPRTKKGGLQKRTHSTPSKYAHLVHDGFRTKNGRQSRHVPFLIKGVNNVNYTSLRNQLTNKL